MTDYEIMLTERFNEFVALLNDDTKRDFAECRNVLFAVFKAGYQSCRHDELDRRIESLEQRLKGNRDANSSD